jgi:CRISPR/Cas system CMR-associated protein Cmr3 (group 5 of RAMP superfamily)
MSHTVDTHFLVEPCESVTFGPPRSSSAGEAHRICSQFPPSPLTFQGLLRTHLLFGANPPLELSSPASRSTIEQLIGLPSELPRDWQLRGPFPAKLIPSTEKDLDERPTVQPWLPAPRFLLRAGPAILHAQEVKSTHPGLSDLDVECPLFGRPDLGDAKPLGGWIGPTNLRYALGRDGRLTWNKDQWQARHPPFVKTESQPGLAIDPKRATARHGMLYFTQALRFERGSGLLGRLQGPLDDRLSAGSLTQGAAQAGRKGRLVAFRAIDRFDADWEHVVQGKHLPAQVEDGERFWLVAITPVRLDDKASTSSETSKHPVLNANVPGEVRIEFQAALTGRAFPIGGYQIADGKPRPNRLYLPAGSAWLIQIRGGSPAARRAALLTLHDRHPLGPANEAAMGFGHTLVGLGPLTTEEEP